MANTIYEHITIAEDREPMVWLGSYPFINVPVYHLNGWSPSPDMFLRQRLAEKLHQIQLQILEPKGLRWIIYDGYRSREVQANIYHYYWHSFSRDNPNLPLAELQKLVGTYVTVPAVASRIPPHATGGSVDLGLYHLQTQKVLDLGAGFDEFTPRARNDFFEQPGQDATIRAWRRFLNQVLIDQGITGDPDEYFHKDYGNQKWAVAACQNHAPYGEITSVFYKNGKVITTYGADESPDKSAERMQRLLDNLELPHPSTQTQAPLYNPSDLVLQMTGQQNGSMAS